MANNSLGSKTGNPVVLPVISSTPLTPFVVPVPINLGSGTGTVSAVMYQNVTRLQGHIRFVKDATPGSGSSAVTFALPAGYTFKTSEIIGNVVGQAQLDGATFGPYISVIYASSTTFHMRLSGGSSNLRGSDLIANGEIYIWLDVPIVEFGLGYVAYGAGRVTGTSPGILPATSQLGSLRVHTSNGYGSTNTRIRRFSTILLNQGTGFTFNQSTVSGDDVTINESGVYSFTYCDEFSAAASFGFTKNSSQLTSSIAANAVASRLAMSQTPAANTTGEVCWTGYLLAGDVIRCHSDATTSGSSVDRANLSVQRLS